MQTVPDVKCIGIRLQEIIRTDMSSRGTLKEKYIRMGRPHFYPTKKINRAAVFLSGFRKLNLKIRRKLFPVPKIQYMLLNIEGFSRASSLDLNTGYYHI